MKRVVFFFSVLGLMLLVFSVMYSGPDKKGYRIKTVVLDAGHGGKDPGAVGLKYHEKDITLKVALKLGGLIESNYPTVKVVYTRKTDVFVEVYKRAQIANQNKADLFISIHCNSSANKSAYGAETFVLGLHRSEENLEVAKKENAAILLEDDYTDKYDGFDPNSPESNIIFSLFQNAFIDQSLLFSQKIQSQIISKLGLFDRGVKQAGFWVLYKTAMPSVLIEIGFISNKNEELIIGSEEGTTKTAQAIFNAFRTYKEKVEDNATAVNPEHNTPPANKDTVKNNQTAIAKVDTTTTTTTTNDDVKIVSFRVQFAASSLNKPPNAPEFGGLKDVRVYHMNNLYRYTSGDFKTLEEAAAWQIEVQNKGFKDAFVVAFLNNVRISPQEAVKLIKNN